MIVTISEKYKDKGYVVYKNLIPKEIIDKLLLTMSNDLLKRKLQYPQMNTQKWGEVSLNEYGYLQDPIGDIHLFELIDENLKNIGRDSLEIITSKEIQGALTEIDSFKKHSLMMSMYFDQNAGTPPHQDWYYLDALPNGGLTAAWIALEDIKEEAGRFYVLPGSHKTVFELNDEELEDADKYENKVRDYIDKNTNIILAPELKKGDVLFWNSGTIHGSHKIIDSKYSRKSITAHYIPEEFDFVHNRYSNEIRDYETLTYNNVKCRITSSITDIDTKGSRSVESFNQEI
jgi:phytanoyl-CoA hydroxylase